MSRLQQVIRPAAVLASAAVVVAAAVTLGPAAHAGAGDGSPTDPNVRYVGRWDPPAATTIGYWDAPYLRTAFTGRTIKVKLRDSANVYVSVDGGAYTFLAGVRGTVNLTPTPLAAGTHQLQLAFRGGAAFQGFVLEAGAATVAPKVSPQLIEYVGDSITFGALTSRLTVSSYGWLTSEALGVEHATIARSGGCLVPTADGCFGLSKEYFKKGVGLTQDWDFPRYDVTAIVVNMGTNDAGHGVTAAQFGSTLLQFFKELRARHPNATLYAFESFRMRYVPELKATVKAFNDAGDPNVYFINTEGWLTSTDFVDGGHPNDGGHAKVAAKLAPILAAHLGAPPAATAYKLVNRANGKVLAVSGASTADGAAVVSAADDGSAGQRWRVVDVGSGFSKLVNSASGKNLDVLARSTAEGAAVIQWRDNGGLNQQWAVSDAGGGFRKLVSRLSGKALDVSVTSTAIQSTDAGTTDQQWQLIAG